MNDNIKAAEKNAVIPESEEAPVAAGETASSKSENADAPEDSAVIEELNGKIAELEAEILRGEIKVSLLLNGILGERLGEAEKLAEGLLAAGKTPSEAAVEIAENYPHFRTARREVPTVSAGSSGSADGFAAIRKIFSIK